MTEKQRVMTEKPRNAETSVLICVPGLRQTRSFSTETRVKSRRKRFRLQIGA